MLCRDFKFSIPKHASSIEIEASFEKVCRKLEQHLSEDLRDLVASTLGFVALNYFIEKVLNHLGHSSKLFIS